MSRRLIWPPWDPGNEGVIDVRVMPCGQAGLFPQSCAMESVPACSNDTDLAKMIFANWFAVGGQNMKVMEARSQIRVGSIEFPDNFLVASNFQQFDTGPLSVIAGDHGIAVRESLNAASVVDQCFADVVVVDAPDDVALGIEFDHTISVRAADDGISVVESNRREWPITLVSTTVVGRKGSQDITSRGIVFLDGEIEQVRGDVVAVWQLPQHSSLHVGVAFWHCNGIALTIWPARLMTIARGSGPSSATRYWPLPSA